VSDSGETLMTGLRLEASGSPVVATTLVDVNQKLAMVRSKVWPLDLRSVPAAVHRLLANPTLDAADTARVMNHFLLSRERLLGIIAAASRAPNVPGGGALSTQVDSHGYSYPQLWLVQDGIDYSRFDRFHVNTADCARRASSVDCIRPDARPCACATSADVVRSTEIFFSAGKLVAAWVAAPRRASTSPCAASL